jgi:hypothetical protein
MLSLELARTLHEERQRGIEARSRVIGLLRGLESPVAAIDRSSAASGRPSRRRVGWTASDGRS